MRFLTPQQIELSGLGDSFGFVISLLLGRLGRFTFIVQDTSGFVEAISFIYFVLSFSLQFDGPLGKWWPDFDLAMLPQSIPRTCIFTSTE